MYSIGIDDSRAFARLSGDFNCQHLDEVQARRLPFGRTVVHGLHTLLTALNAFAESRDRSFNLKQIRASFVSPLHQGDVFSVEIAGSGPDVKINVSTHGRQLCTIAFSIHEAERDPAVSDGNVEYDSAIASFVGEGDILGRCGEARPTISNRLMQQIFPHLWEKADLDQIGVLLASTRIVGMECPGERSIFKYLSFFFERNKDDSSFRYSVDRFETGSSLASISLKGSWLRVNLHTILRAQPVDQTSYSEVKRAISGSPFQDQHVLVVGGTRGLGEVSAKIAAAGGARVSIGYALGRDDAVKVSEEINVGGGSTSVVEVNVEKGVLQVSEISEPVTHIYYFASPHIDFNTRPEIDRNLLEKYLKFYVYGLELSIDRLVEAGLLANDFDVFMPSTVFVDDPKAGAFEYAAAKSMAEVYLTYMAGKSGKSIITHSPRLPMIRTDQTSNVDGELPTALEVLLPLLPRTHSKA